MNKQINKYIYIYVVLVPVFPLHYEKSLSSLSLGLRLFVNSCNSRAARRPYTQRYGLIGSTPQFWRGGVSWFCAFWGCTTPYTKPKI